MELLPDELYLFVFRYLHKFDSIYAFSNLNNRFQQLIKPYIYDIDLTQASISYKHFQVFLHHILPSCGNEIYSLTINGYPQLHLLEPHISYLTNLTSVTLKLDARINDYAPKQFQYYTTQLFILNTLTELYMFEEAGSSVVILKNICCSSTSQNLCSLSLFNRDWNLNFDEISYKMPHVKYLSINIVSIKQLRKIFKIMINLVELKVCLECCRDSQKLYFYDVPQTLKNLQLEFRNCEHFYYPMRNLRSLKGFLNLFKINLKSLKLIIHSLPREFENFDQFQSLVSSFKQLETFHYDILLESQPDPHFPNVEQLSNTKFSAFTLPRPQSLSRIFSPPEQHFSYISLLTLDQLFHCSKLSIDSHYSLPIINDNTKFRHLEEMRINVTRKELIPDLCQRLSELIAQAPNLYALQMFGIDDTEILIHVMRKLILDEKSRRKILEFQFENYDPYYKTFFNQLAELLPDLRLLTIDCDEQFTDVYPYSLNSFIQELRIAFSKLIHFKMRMSLRYYRIRNALENYKKDLDQNVSLCYWLKSNDDSYIYLNIWL